MEEKDMKVEPKVEPKKGVDIKRFKERGLACINKMSNRRKASFNAGQILKNK